ncbi:MAG TPA: hypothetical protein VKV26_21805 [Dehalococcoidia bacterium]|nr:hypothetical protein [Dehalococcoidia bacterium]
MSANNVNGAAEQRNRNADSSIADDLVRAAERLSRAAQTLADAARRRGSGALAADALRAQRLAAAAAGLARIIAADLTAPPAPGRCTCATCAPWGAEPWVDLRDVPPAVHRG